MKVINILVPRTISSMILEVMLLLGITVLWWSMAARRKRRKNRRAEDVAEL